jgi:hypothetical protein
MALKSEDREDRIRRRAYMLWLDAGLSDGASLEYWQCAEAQEAEAEAKATSGAGETFPANDPERPATQQRPA